MPNMSLKKNPMPAQEPAVRAHNFDEVALGYTPEQAMDEAARCLNCKNKPCVAGCPVAIDIPAFIGKVKEGDFAAAYEILSRSTSLPAVCGRVCPQETQCESKCVRGIKGEPVAIGRLERFVADWHMHNAQEKPARPTPNGHKAAVIGAGPAGLTCAGDLARKGYDVTIFEALHTAGGVLVYGIPEFRLPKAIVEKEIDTLRDLGVKVETNMVIGKVLSVDELFDMGFESVFIGSGAGLPRFMNIPGENLKGVYSANEFLTRVNLMKAFRKDNPTPVKELPARREEVEHAQEEGVEFLLLNNPVEILGDEHKNVTAIRCVKMTLGEPDESGRRRPVPQEGSEFELAVDCVIMAIGTSPNPLLRSTTPGLDTQKWGGIIADEETGATSREGVFAGGDAVTGAATVILAMGAGKNAAAAMDAYMQGKN